MAEGDQKEKSDRMTLELSLNEEESYSASSVASDAPAEQEARAELALATAENTTEPELPAVHVLSDIIIHRYEGGRSGELFHGEGVAYFRGGHVYKGNFVDGFMHGHGEYTWADGLKYEGDFESNAPMGHGTYTWLDCSTYEGEVCNGICHGTGTYKSAKTCTVYRGQWHKGQRHGKGTMYYNQEATSWYKGDWENNQREGWGMRCYPSGDTYEGQWKNSVRHGEGTMKWIHLGQQYSGQWLNGVQHGYGIHTWFVRRVSGSQYPLRNEYEGEFAQGLRHGQGTFFYASGAVYSGCWKDNKKHGQGKFIFKNGRLYEGEFIDDRMAEFPASSTISLCALGGLPSRAEESGNSASLLGPDMALNIETLLNRIPEAQRRQELRQVEFAIMRHIALLRPIYSLYSSLGHENSPDNTFLLSHLQFWRFLKDCSVHQHGLTLAQLDHLINKDISPGEVHSPFSTMLLRKWISCVVIAAYHIYHRDFESSSYVLAECFSKLMRQNIIPNAKNVKGPLYCHPLRAVIGKNYTDRCWEIYQTVPKVTSAAISDNIMTARHFIWMFKVLGLFDHTLTTRRLLEILSLENPAIYSSTHSNLDLEITFLEFFEALLGCAEVKNTDGFRTAQHRQCELGYPVETSSRDQMKNSPILSQLASPQQYESTVLSSSTISSSAATSVKSLEEFKSKATTQSSLTEEIQYKDQGIDLSKLAVTKTPEMELNKQTTSSVLDTHGTKPPCTNTVAEDGRPEEQLENWINRIHQFFTHIFFPAYEHTLVWKKEMQKEHQRQTTEHRITLEKAKANAKLREQRRAEEESSKEKEESFKEIMEEEEERSHVLDDQNNSPAALTTPVTSSNSVDLKQSPTNKKKKKRK
ncbi:radial spoke head 10 homolog B isoform X2 [Pangasianodon hypophthalmus]|uniref:radial spoke head 10 homolog B isoform X2 n=1 Tax=Pangasianodon hypophthalmus TaxID=310915 RepID=UPI002307C913|nr:radial spoke head 10 homolog B isoform X2 [Pangasianodon hypophthalmus]